MKWFKHVSDLRYDTRIRRLVNRHGVAGYGLYCFVLEAITMSLETDSPTPELEDTAQDLADYLRMEVDEVEAILTFCLDQGLFDMNPSNGHLRCNKIYKYLDKSTTRNIELKNMIDNYGKVSQAIPDVPILSDIVQECPGQIQTSQDSPGLSVPEEKRIEENIYPPLDTKVSVPPKGRTHPKFVKPTLDEVRAYCLERDNGVDPQRFWDFYESKGWIVGKSPMRDWKASVRTWEKEEGRRARASPAGTWRPEGYAFDPGGYDEL